MQQDYIHVNGLRAYGYTGAYQEEQILGQWYEIDLTLWLDLAQAGHSDRLEDTCDYGTIVKEVQHLVRTARFSLIEKLAEAIAELTLSHASVETVTVRLCKVSPPIPDFSGRVSVEITRPLKAR